MKKLSLTDIKSGLLVSKLEKVAVDLVVDGEECEFEIYIKPFSYSTAIAQMRAYGENREALAGVLASCLCDEKGELAFTEDEVRENFSQLLVDAIWEKVYEVNSLGKEKPSPKTKKSSAKSQSQQENPSEKLES